MGRIRWLDFTRSFAIFAVVLCHVVEKAYLFFKADAIGAFAFQSKTFGFLSMALARLGVPLFLMLTGYLLLARRYDEKACIDFWLKRWLPLFLCVEVWNLLYSVFLFYMKKSVTVDTVVQGLLFLHRLEINHIWYLPIILGMYLMLPVMAMALERLSPRTLAFPVAVTFVAFSILPTLQPAMSIVGMNWGNTILDPGFGAGLYGLYLFAGWAINKGALKSLSTRMLIITLVASLSLLIVYEMWLLSNRVSYFLWYSNSMLLVASVSLFELLSRMSCPSSLEKAVTLVSRYSFAIYLVHYPLLMLLEPYTAQLELSRPLLVLFCSVVLFVLSLCVSWMISKIPVVGKRLLYMR